MSKSDSTYLCILAQTEHTHSLVTLQLAAVSSQHWEQWLYTGLMGNAKVEYYLRIQCYCLQWLNVTHMDENSF